MLTAAKIQRAVAKGAWEALLRDLVRNGRPLTIAALAQLNGPRSVEFAALGFVLQRAIELSWGMDADVEALAVRACASVESADLSPGGALPGAIAVMARGLWDVRDAAAARGWAWQVNGLGERVEAALVRCGHVLLEAQAHTAVHRRHERGLVGGRLDSAIVMWQLGGLDVGGERSLWLGSRGGVDLEYLRAAVDRVGLWNDDACAALMERAGLVPERSGRRRALAA